MMDMVISIGVIGEMIEIEPIIFSNFRDLDIMLKNDLKKKKNVLVQTTLLSLNLFSDNNTKISKCVALSHIVNSLLVAKPILRYL